MTYSKNTPIATVQFLSSFRSASVQLPLCMQIGHLEIYMGMTWTRFGETTRGCFRSASVQLAFRFRYPDVFKVLVFGGTWAWEV